MLVMGVLLGAVSFGWGSLSATKTRTVACCELAMFFAVLGVALVLFTDVSQRTGGATVLEEMVCRGR